MEREGRRGKGGRGEGTGKMNKISKYNHIEIRKGLGRMLGSGEQKRIYVNANFSVNNIFDTKSH